MKKCIILANGKAPQKKVVTFLYKKGYDKLICADGGANSALKLNLVPDYIIGDLDSISKETLNYYSGKSEIIRITRQNDTDVEKCLKFAIRQKNEECVLLGGIGNRLDHSFCNLGIVLKFSDKIKIKVISDKSILTVEMGSVLFNTIPNEIISLYAFNDKTFISSKGLKYPLNKDILPFGSKESTSNIATSTEVQLKIEGGKIFLIRDYNTVSRNGLF
jgi:thiamine pyrophosphokinase